MADEPVEEASREAPERTSGAPAETEESLRAERDLLQERLQRAAADYQNLRRRLSAESDERVRRTLQPLLAKMLTVLDYLDMALACPATSEESRNLAVGVRLTRDQFLQALEQENVRPIPAGERFDPALHEASASVVRADLSEGSIVETVRQGYTWRGELLRHAQVIVSTPEPPREAVSDEEG
jgi:molecular chaperone GrpE